MITAKAAKFYTSEEIERKLSSENIEIEKAIEVAISKGEMDISIYRPLMPHTVSNLKSLGYKVSCKDDRNETYYQISWADAEAH